MERKLGLRRRGLRQGEAGRYGRASKALRRGRRRAARGAAAGAAGRPRSPAARSSSRASWRCGWSVFKAGFQSARDPRYTVLPQRERLRQSGAGSTG